MICPNCKNRLTVIDTRPNYRDKPEVYRKMICKRCGEWYFSEERIRSATDKEFYRKWERSDRNLIRKKKQLEKVIHDVYGVEED